jgi:hypothetical protein
MPNLSTGPDSNGRAKRKDNPFNPAIHPVLIIIYRVRPVGGVSSAARDFTPLYHLEPST